MVEAGRVPVEVVTDTRVPRNWSARRIGVAGARSPIRCLICGCPRGLGLGPWPGLAGGDREQLGGEGLDLTLDGGGVDADVGVG